MQNDKFKFQTVANTRQMVPAKKSKKNPKPAQKKILKLFHTHFIGVGGAVSMGNDIVNTVSYCKIFKHTVIE